MAELMIILGKVALGFLCMTGPFVLMLAGLSIRDRREAAIGTSVLQALNTPDLRGMFSVEIKSRPFAADTVVVDLASCSREQAWGILERLSTQLPPAVRVVVNGPGDCRARSKWTLTATSRTQAIAYCQQGC